MPFSSMANDVATFLAKLIRLANSNIQFEAKVANFLSLLKFQLGLDKTLLLFLNRENRKLTPYPIDDLTIPKEPLLVSDTFFDRAITNRQSLLADELDLKNLPPQWQEYFAPYLSCLAIVPISDDKTCYGILTVLCQNSCVLNSSPNSLVMEAVSNQLSLAIKTNQLASDTRKRISVLNVLSDLGKSLAATIEVDVVMSMIPRIATGVFIADGCTLNVLDGSGEKLLYSSLYGAVPPAYNFLRYQGQSPPTSVGETLRRNELFMG
ncbi:MAG: hypothetical protein LBT62_04540, partial [Deltaproteobacteria bacterium]|nr:hypothetical protein [Deltaproteobacteria bacterium]